MRLQRRGKPFCTSSKPPSTDQKRTREGSRPGGTKPEHKRHARAPVKMPDAHEDRLPAHWQHYGLPIAVAATAEAIGEFDEIDLPQVKPLAQRHPRLACRCLKCCMAAIAPVQKAAPGAPFGRCINALALWLKTNQMFSCQELQSVFCDLFGLETSAKARRCHRGLAPRTGYACDKIGTRIEGCNGYGSVFCAPDAVIRTAAPVVVSRPA